MNLISTYTWIKYERHTRRNKKKKKASRSGNEWKASEKFAPARNQTRELATLRQKPFLRANKAGKYFFPEHFLDT